MTIPQTNDFSLLCKKIKILGRAHKLPKGNHFQNKYESEVIAILKKYSNEELLKILSHDLFLDLLLKCGSTKVMEFFPRKEKVSFTSARDDTTIFVPINTDLSFVSAMIDRGVPISWALISKLLNSGNIDKINYVLMDLSPLALWLNGEEHFSIRWRTILDNTTAAAFLAKQMHDHSIEAQKLWRIARTVTRRSSYIWSCAIQSVLDISEKDLSLFKNPVEELFKEAEILSNHQTLFLQSVLTNPVKMHQFLAPLSHKAIRTGETKIPGLLDFRPEVPLP